MSRTPFRSLEREEQDLVVKGYAGAFERWASTHRVPDDLAQAVKYWWVQAGPTSYGANDGQCLREAIIALLQRERVAG